MKITEKQRLMGIGIMAQIENHYREMNKYIELFNRIYTNSDDDKDHVFDSIYGYEEFDFDKIAEKLNIEVED